MKPIWQTNFCIPVLPKNLRSNHDKSFVFIYSCLFYHMRQFFSVLIVSLVFFGFFLNGFERKLFRDSILFTGRVLSSVSGIVCQLSCNFLLFIFDFYFSHLILCPEVKNRFLLCHLALFTWRFSSILWGYVLVLNSLRQHSFLRF